MCGHTPGPSHKSGPCEHGVWGLLGSQGEAGAERTRDQNLTVLLEAQTQAAQPQFTHTPSGLGLTLGIVTQWQQDVSCPQPQHSLPPRGQLRAANGTLAFLSASRSMSSLMAQLHTRYVEHSRQEARSLRCEDLSFPCHYCVHSTLLSFIPAKCWMAPDIPTAI